MNGHSNGKWLPSVYPARHAGQRPHRYPQANHGMFHDEAPSSPKGSWRDTSRAPFQETEHRELDHENGRRNTPHHRWRPRNDR